MSDIQQVQDSVTGLQIDQTALKVTVARNHAQLSAVCKGTSKMVNRIDDELFGNGRPGLVSKMSEVQVTQRLMLKAMWLIGGAVVTTGLGIIGVLLMG